MEESNLLGVARSATPEPAKIPLPAPPAPPSPEPSASASADSASSEFSAATNAPSSKPQRKYERKTKRFVWPDELHRLFVASIFDLGLKNASPKALMPFMGVAAATSGLTTEHLKSHLQKYRINYERSRQEFLEFYDETAKRNQKRRRRSSKSAATGEQQTMFVFPIRARRSSVVDTTSAKAGAGRGEVSTSNPDEDDNMEESGTEDDGDEDAERDAERDAAKTRSEACVSMNGAARRGSPTAHSTPSASYNAEDPQGKYYQHLLHSAQYAASTAHGRLPDSGERPQQQPPSLSAGGAETRFSDQLPSSHAHKNSIDLLNIAQQYANSVGAGGSASGVRYTTGLYDNTTAAAVAAAAAAAAATGTPLTDPQWTILASLLSPQLGAATAAHQHMNDHRKQPEETFSLDTEPSDLQMQMHLAMQAQMNLHRQMLTRKVAVSQHLLNGQQSSSTIGHFPPGMTDVTPWNHAAYGHQPPAYFLRQQLINAAQLQQQQHQHHHQHLLPPHSHHQIQHYQHQQQLSHAVSQPIQHQPTTHGQRVLPVSSQPPNSDDEAMSTPTVESPANSSALTRATLAAPQLGTGLGPTSTSEIMMPSSSAAVVPPASATSSESLVAAAASTTAGALGELPPSLRDLAAKHTVGDAATTSLDVYRWDQMELQMTLSDDEDGDLFSFLRT